MALTPLGCQLSVIQLTMPTLDRPHPPKANIMGYEDSVYLAKLAEQAERYEGMLSRCDRSELPS